jgi:hypothetical protein
MTDSIRGRSSARTSKARLSREDGRLRVLSTFGPGYRDMGLPRVQLTDRGVGAAAQYLGGQFGEPAFDHVEP